MRTERLRALRRSGNAPIIPDVGGVSISGAGHRMKLRVLFLLAVPLCPLGCTSSKPETSSRYSNAFKPRDVKTVKAEEAPIVAGKTSKVYHTRHCRYAAALNGVVGYVTARDA